MAGSLFVVGTGDLRLDLLAGLVGATIAAVLTYPIETMKTRRQIGKSPVSTKHGIRGLYRGIGVSMARKCPEKAVSMVVGRMVRLQILKSSTTAADLALGQLAYWWFLAAACASTLTVSFLKVPLELLNKNIQAGSIESYRSIMNRLFCSPASVPLLCYSWMAIMIRDTPKEFLRFIAVQALLEFHFLGTSSLSLQALRITYTAIGSALAAYITTPLDLMASRIMTQLTEQVQVSKGKLMWSSEGLARSVTFRPLGPWEGLRKITRDIYEKNGIRGFWCGSRLRVLQQMGFSTISFMIFQALTGEDARWYHADHS